MTDADADRALKRRLVHLQQCCDMGLLTGLKRHLADSRRQFPFAAELDQFDLAVEVMVRCELEHGVGSSLCLDHPGVIELMNFKRTTITPEMVGNARRLHPSYVP